MVERIVSQFVTVHGETHRRLAAAIAARDTGTVADLAHRLKGAAGPVGARGLADLCRIIEAAAISGDWPYLDAIRPDLDSLMALARKRVDAAIVHDTGTPS